MKETFREQLKRVTERNARVEALEQRIADLEAELAVRVAANHELRSELDMARAVACDDDQAAMALAFISEAQRILAERSFNHIYATAHAKLHPNVYPKRSK